MQATDPKPATSPITSSQRIGGHTPARPREFHGPRVKLLAASSLTATAMPRLPALRHSRPPSGNGKLETRPGWPAHATVLAAPNAAAYHPATAVPAHEARTSQEEGP